MQLYEYHPKDLEKAKVHLDFLVETGNILGYEIRPSYGEYDFDVYVKPVQVVEHIEITSITSPHKEFKLG